MAKSYHGIISNSSAVMVEYQPVKRIGSLRMEKKDLLDTY